MFTLRGWNGSESLFLDPSVRSGTGAALKLLPIYLYENNLYNPWRLAMCLLYLWSTKLGILPHHLSKLFDYIIIWKGTHGESSHGWWNPGDMVILRYLICAYKKVIFVSCSTTTNIKRYISCFTVLNFSLWAGCLAEQQPFFFLTSLPLLHVIKNSMWHTWDDL